MDTLGMIATILLLLGLLVGTVFLKSRFAARVLAVVVAVPILGAVGFFFWKLPWLLVFGAAWCLLLLLLKTVFRAMRPSLQRISWKGTKGFLLAMLCMSLPILALHFYGMVAGLLTVIAIVLITGLFVALEHLHNTRKA